VNVEGSELLGGDAAARERLGQQLQYNIKERIGVTARIAVASPGSLERSIGKAKRVIDKRQIRF
jgi:phenylacetate-CoA ligase